MSENPYEPPKGNTPHGPSKLHMLKLFALVPIPFVAGWIGLQIGFEQFVHQPPHWLPHLIGVGLTFLVGVAFFVATTVASLWAANRILKESRA